MIGRNEFVLLLQPALLHGFLINLPCLSVLGAACAMSGPSELQLLFCCRTIAAGEGKGLALWPIKGT